MKKFKALFATPKKAAISACCAAAMLALVAVLATFAVGAIAQSSSIGEENAKKFALADAGIDPASGVQPRAKFDFEDGHFVYEVEFTADGSEYEYLIMASDGSVIKKDVEFVDANGNNVKASASITVDEAKEAALADAGLSPSEVLKFTKEKLDYDDGVSVYDIEFYTADKEYEYEIDAATGAVLSRDVEPLKSSSVSENGGTDDPDTFESADIGIDRAKEAALADANVSAEDATFTKAERDTIDEQGFDNGRTVYDVEFYTAGKQYEYEIDAATGVVLSREVEPTKTSSESGNGNSVTDDPTTPEPADIGIDRAKEAALADANVSAADVTFTKAAQDFDDGKTVYDIEFYTDDKEYDYEIDAATGEIRSRDVEPTKASSESGNGNGNSGTYISVEQAKTAALEHAGLSASDVTFSKAKLDRDDGRVVYEIEFYRGRTEYEYKINAVNGNVLEHECEDDDHDHDD